MTLSFDDGALAERRRRMASLAVLSSLVLTACGGGGGDSGGAGSPSPAAGPSPAPAPAATGALFFSQAGQLRRYDVTTQAESAVTLDIESTDLVGYGGGKFSDVSQGTPGGPYTVHFHTYGATGFNDMGTLPSTFSVTQGFISGPLVPSPDGSLYVFHTLERASLGAPQIDYVQVMDAGINGRLRLSGYHDPAWVGNDRLVVAGDDGIFLASLAAPSATPTRIGPQNLGQAGAVPQHLAVSPDGTSIAFIQANALWRIGLDGSGLAQLTTASTGLAWPAWSPDGARLAVQRGDCAVSGTSSPNPDVALVSATTTQQNVDQVQPLMRSINASLQSCGPKVWLP